MQIKAWEEEELDKAIDMEQIRVDPSPFQLVERTSLHKVTAGFAAVTVTGLEKNVACKERSCHEKKKSANGSWKYAVEEARMKTC